MSINKKQQAINKSKRDRCKGCGNLQQYTDKEGRKKSFCIAFENIYMNQKYLGSCPFEDKKEIWRRYGYTLEEEDYCPYVKRIEEQ